MDSTATCTGSPRKRTRASRAAALLLAAVLTLPAVAAEPKLLPPEEAFRFSARALDEHTIEARFAVAAGYYLYRDKMHFTVTPDKAALAVPPLPAGKTKEDQFFGKVETYRGDVVVTLAIPGGGAGQSVVLAADSQGCADQGVCYPPTIQKVTLVLPAAGKGPGPVVEAFPLKKRWFN